MKRAVEALLFSACRTLNEKGTTLGHGNGFSPIHYIGFLCFLRLRSSAASPLTLLLRYLVGLVDTDGNLQPTRIGVYQSNTMFMFALMVVLCAIFGKSGISLIVSRKNGSWREWGSASIMKGRLCRINFSVVIKRRAQLFDMLVDVGARKGTFKKSTFVAIRDDNMLLPVEGNEVLVRWHNDPVSYRCVVLPGCQHVRCEDDGEVYSFVAQGEGADEWEWLE